MLGDQELSDEGWQVAVLLVVLVLHPALLSAEELRREVLADARQSGVTWLRLDPVNGLWQFTSWSQMSLPAKLAMLTEVALPVLGELDGLVITSGNLQRQGDFQDEDAFGPADGFALRRLIEPSRVRETLVLPGQRATPTALAWWRTAYASEPRQLEWALAECDRSPITEMLSTTP